MTAAAPTVTVALAHRATWELFQQASFGNLQLDYVANGDIPSNRMYTLLSGRHEWDVGELAMSSFLMAHDLGSENRGLPIFPSRMFPHAGVWVHQRAGIHHPADLVGKRVGCNSFGTNYSVWWRGILAHQYDVPIDRITWVESLAEHRPDYRPPRRFAIERSATGERSETLLARGEIDAATTAGAGLVQAAADVRPLFADPLAEMQQYVERFGFLPVNTVLIVRRPVLRRQPDLPRRLLDGLAEARVLHTSEEPRDEEAASRALEQATGRTLTAFGFQANRVAIREMIGYCYEQGIIRRLYDPEDLFVLPES